jgi:hypothetical protein
MSKSPRIPKRALKRYADLILRQIYQSGGRERYVPVTELEDALGLEPSRILRLCRTQLLGEVHVASRLPVDAEESTESWSPAQRLWMRSFYSQPHVRIRPGNIRLTEEELLRERRKRKRKRNQKRKNEKKPK